MIWKFWFMIGNFWIQWSESWIQSSKKFGSDALKNLDPIICKFGSNDRKVLIYDRKVLLQWSESLNPMLWKLGPKDQFWSMIGNFCSNDLKIWIQVSDYLDPMLWWFGSNDVIAWIQRSKGLIQRILNGWIQRIQKRLDPGLGVADS